MNILHVIPYFNPNRGGDVNVCYNMVKGLKDKGHSITLLTTDFEFDEKLANSLEKKGIIIVKFRSIINISLFLYSPAMSSWLRNNIMNFDIVHLHNFRSYQNYVVCLNSQNIDIPVILQPHGSILPIFKKTIFKRIFDFFMGNKILKTASKFIAISEMELNQFREIGLNESKIELIPNGVNTKILNNLPNKGIFKKKYYIHDNERIILYLGRIHPIKGIGTIIKVLPEIIKEINNVKLLIVGPDSGFKTKLEHEIKYLRVADKVIFTGPLYENDKYSAYVDADVYILPSSYEIFGITLLESILCGTPVICTNRCGIAPIIDGVAGISVNDDKNGIKNGLLYMLKNPEKAQSFAKNGKNLINDKFKWEKILNQLENVYYITKHS